MKIIAQSHENQETVPTGSRFRYFVVEDHFSWDGESRWTRAWAYTPGEPEPALPLLERVLDGLPYSDDPWYDGAWFPIIDDVSHLEAELNRLEPSMSPMWRC